MSRNHGPGDCFAHLEPHNRAARLAFSSVVEASLRQPADQYAYHLRHMQINDEQQLFTEAGCNVHTNSGTESDATIPDSDLEDMLMPSTKIWTGRYCLRNEGPEFPMVGWRLGYGRSWSKFPTGEVDLLLNIGKGFGIRGAHALLKFTSDGVLIIQARHPYQCTTMIDAEDIASMKEGYALAAKPAYNVTLGEAEYNFKHTIPETREEREVRRSNLKEFFKLKLGKTLTSELVSETPTPSTMTIGNWSIHGVAGLSLSTVIRSAVHKDARVAAAKIILCRGRSDSKVHDEIRTYKLIKEHMKNAEGAACIMQMEECLYERGEDHGEPQNVYMIFRPLAIGTFQHLVRFHRSAEIFELHTSKFITMTHQVLTGLSALHAKGWIHRDIKPANLGVIQYNPPSAVVIDLGQAKHIGADRNCTIQAQPGSCGTIGYIAPEMEAKDSHYGTAADIWAMACVMLEVFNIEMTWKRKFNPWSSELDQSLQDEALVARNEHSKQQQAFMQEPDGSLKNLLGRMLCRDPRDRIDMKALLSHGIFDASKALT